MHSDFKLLAHRNSDINAHTAISAIRMWVAIGPIKRSLRNKILISHKLSYTKI